MAVFEPPPLLRPLFLRIDALAAARGESAFAVGGTVRDVLLGRQVRDIDLGVEDDALTFARALAADFDGHYVPLDDANGIARVVLIDSSVRHIDVAGVPGKIEADLLRRDFTIDALAAPVPGGDVIDVTNGLADLRAGVVRMVSAANLDADPLRLLRAVRLAGELGFSLEPETAAAVTSRAGRIGEAAPERRRDELARIFALDQVEPSLRLLDHLGLLDQLIPEMASGRGVSQPANHHAYDVFEHAMHAVAALDVMLAPIRPEGDRVWIHEEFWSGFAWCQDALRAYLLEELSEGRTRGTVLKLTTFLHDVAKPETRTVEPDGRIRFFGHADRGAVVARRIMRRYRFSSAETAFAVKLVGEHLRPVQLAQVGEAPTARAIYRFHRDLGDAAPAVLLLALADAAGSRGPGMTRAGWSGHVAYMNSLLVRLRETEGIVSAPRLLTGHDIMSEFGLSEGPRIGLLLEGLGEAQATGEVRDREGAMAYVRARLSREEGT